MLRTWSEVPCVVLFCRSSLILHAVSLCTCAMWGCWKVIVATRTTFVILKIEMAMVRILLYFTWIVCFLIWDVCSTRSIVEDSHWDHYNTVSISFWYRMIDCIDIWKGSMNVWSRTKYFTKRLTTPHRQDILCVSSTKITYASVSLHCFEYKGPSWYNITFELYFEMCLR